MKALKTARPVGPTPTSCPHHPDEQGKESWNRPPRPIIARVCWRASWEIPEPRVSATRSRITLAWLTRARILRSRQVACADAGGIASATTRSAATSHHPTRTGRTRSQAFLRSEPRGRSPRREDFPQPRSVRSLMGLPCPKRWETNPSAIQMSLSAGETRKAVSGAQAADPASTSAAS